MKRTLPPPPSDSEQPATKSRRIEPADLPSLDLPWRFITVEGEGGMLTTTEWDPKSSSDCTAVATALVRAMAANTAQDVIDWFCGRWDGAGRRPAEFRDIPREALGKTRIVAETEYHFSGTVFVYESPRRVK